MVVWVPQPWCHFRLSAEVAVARGSLFRDPHGWKRTTYNIICAFCASNCLHGTAPCTQDVIQPVAEVTSRRRLRSASSSALVVPATRRSTLGDRAFAVAEPRAWNSLPQFVTDLSPSRNILRHSNLAYLFRTRIRLLIAYVSRSCSSYKPPTTL